MVKNRERRRLSNFTLTFVSVRVGELLKSIFILLLLIICAAITYYFHFVLGTEAVYTHFFYLPIVLTSLWWGKRALFVSAFLALFLSSSHFISGIEHPVTDDILRATMFILVASVVGTAIDERNRLHEEALTEKNGKIKEMENHAKYVDKVAHGLRNPLQVLIGALESVEMEKLNSGQRELIEMLNEATEEIGKNIKELTRRDEYHQDTGGRGQSKG